MALRVGLLGTGGIGARHLSAAAAVEGLQVVAVCGREPSQAEAFGARFHAKAFTDFERMLGEERLDLLIVALPPFAHRGQVEAAALAGVNLLVEKPIALDMGRAEAMVAASGEVVAACGFMYRFGAAVQRWDGLRISGETGRIGHFAGSYHANALHAPWWRERAKSGGQLVEQAIHIVDLLRCNLGMPQSVYAKASTIVHRDVPDYTSEDASAVLFGYDDGSIGVLHASNMAVPGRWMKQWQVLGEKMSGLFTDYNTAELVRHRPEVASESIASSLNPFVAQLEDVKGAILGKRGPRVPLADGAATLRIVLAARQAADEGREVVL